MAISINPSTGEFIQKYPATSEQELMSILQKGTSAFQVWSVSSFQERAERLLTARGILLHKKETLARLITLEMGKPIAQSRAEIEKCAMACEFYARNGEKFLTPELLPTEAQRSFVSFEPLGLVLAVMPWNFPFWQVFRFAAPSLMAGNAIVLKHASNVSGCALEIEAVFREAKYPENLFRAVILDGSEVAAWVHRPEIQAVTLTGSSRAGESIGAAAGRALKKAVLELGGSDPYLILADADIAQAAAACVQSRLVNSGQSCIAAKRFIVVPEIREAFEREMVERMKHVSWGDPRLETTEVGPLARPDLREELHRQVQRSVAAGARLLLGGEIPSGPGVFYPPTVLGEVHPGMPAYHEEMFGPVAAIVPVENEEAAIVAANDTSFGLGAAVFTRDLARGEKIAKERLQAGSCFVNTWVRSDPRLPFGGIKASGFGRELGRFGIREFVNIKTVWVQG